MKWGILPPAPFPKNTGLQNVGEGQTPFTLTKQQAYSILVKDTNEINKSSAEIITATEERFLFVETGLKV